MAYREKPRPRPDFVIDRRGTARSQASVKAGRTKVRVAAVLASLLAAAPTGGLGEAARSLSMSAVNAATDLIARRSPGRRVQADFNKGKGVRIAPVVRSRPVVRRPVVPRAPIVAPVLSQLLTAPPERQALAFADAPFVTGQPDFAGLVPGPIGEDFACLCNPPRLPEPSAGVIIFVPGAPPTLGPPPVDGGGPRPPAVPEPSAWAMMIMGFAFMGTLWRRRRVIAEFIGAPALLRLTFAPALARRIG